MTWRIVRFALAPVIGLALVACGDRTSAPAASTSAMPSPVTLAIADRNNENVALAIAGSTVAAAWSATDAENVEDVYAAVSRNGGATFSTPVRVNAEPGQARINGEQPPRPVIRSGPDGREEIDIFWTVSKPGGTGFAAARSRDAGLTFTALAVPSHVNAQGNRGWAIFQPSGDGRIDAAWLDHRRMAPPPGATAGAQRHDHTAHSAGRDIDSVAMAQRSDLYYASFTMPGDGAAIAAAPAARALLPGVCYCCKTAMAHGVGGAVYIAWRHVYPGDMRDIAFVASHDGGRTFSDPVRVNEDRWAIKGCPDDGPSLSADGAGRVHIVWPTMVVGQETATKTIFYSSAGNERTFVAPVALPAKGHGHHPQVTAASGGRAVAAWDEADGDRRTVAFAVGTPDANGHMQFVRWGDLDVAGTYPALAGQAGGVLAAWVSKRDGAKSVIRVQRILAGS